MNNRPYLEEMIDAAKGVFALIRGEKDKLGYFNFSQSGLVGSFIAVLIGLALQEVFSGPGPEDLQVPAWANLISYALLYATPFLVAYGFLSIIGERDRMLGYMVANNWASFFFTLILVAIFIFQLLASVGYFVIVVLTILVFWRTARLILGFTIPQTIIFFVATIMAVLMAAMLTVNILFAAAGVDPAVFLDAQTSGV
ncbi:hypothetical protein [Maritalea myrionectae]|mgnify:CR=1 FL=1|uniref:Yip1 domain-containing protein n=1 Tax=Maritalea myrionectae TaxID=454601 RepID=A0A2R4MI63_9HYPH|nr:hypothetical protein [Maritalea myrionectae]AVX05589.1 hypothetical protein MXMO3_03083 [Maritalea myrionectae]